MRKTLAALVFATLLACSGALEAMAPVPLVPPPADTTITGINTAINNGVSTTEMSYATETAAADVRSHYETQLTDAGWSVAASGAQEGTPDETSVIAATKDSDSFTVTIGNGEIHTVWVQP